MDLTSSRFPFVLCALLSLCALVQSRTTHSEVAQVPSYVVDYAPIVYLDVNEVNLPADIGGQLENTIPTVNVSATIPESWTLTLQNLSTISDSQHCSFKHFNGCPVYMNVKGDELNYKNPIYYGVLPNPETGETEQATSSTIIVHDHGDGEVDAYYMFFYSFNLGDKTPVGYQGNHVGDWEHTMIRFINGTPSTMWFSQHSSGQVMTYEALTKQGIRPIVYSAIGTHANYPRPGQHIRDIVGHVITVTDYTSPGIAWDPTRNAFYYMFTPASTNTSIDYGSFAPAEASGLNNSSPYEKAPTDWLKYYGKWGNDELPWYHPGQVDLFGLEETWAVGPTGPYDKDLNRKDTCPDGLQSASPYPCSPTSTLAAVTGNPCPHPTVTRPAVTSALATSHIYAHRRELCEGDAVKQYSLRSHMWAGVVVSIVGLFFI